MILVVTNRSSERGSFGGQIGDLSYVAPLRGDYPGRLETVSPEQFRGALLDALSGGPDLPKRIVCMVHGFNVSWGESLEYFERIDRDISQKLAGKSVTVGFSWPSKGRATSYLDDRSSARQSAEHFAVLVMQAIRALELYQCEAELCLIAHSMGAYLVAKAAQHAHAAMGHPRSYNVFSEVLLVAPDLDAEALEPGHVGDAIAAFARRLTIYYSRADRALYASSVKRGGLTGPRLGRQGPADPSLLPPNVVAVDATSVTTDLDVGPHGAHFRSEHVLRDIRSVMSGVDRDEIQGRKEVDRGGFRIQS